MKSRKWMGTTLIYVLICSKLQLYWFWLQVITWRCVNSHKGWQGREGKMLITWLRVCRHHSFSLGKNPQDSPTSSGEQVFFWFVCLFVCLFLSMFFQPQHYNVLSQIILLLCMIKCLMANTFTTWCKEPTHWKKTLILGKIEGRRRRGR